MTQWRTRWWRGDEELEILVTAKNDNENVVAWQNGCSLLRWRTGCHIIHDTLANRCLMMSFRMTRFLDSSLVMSFHLLILGVMLVKCNLAEHMCFCSFCTLCRLCAVCGVRCCAMGFWMVIFLLSSACFTANVEITKMSHEIELLQKCSITEQFGEKSNRKRMQTFVTGVFPIQILQIELVENQKMILEWLFGKLQKHIRAMLLEKAETTAHKNKRRQNVKQSQFPCT